MERIYKLSLFVNILTLVIMGVVSLILVFTPYKANIFSLILGSLMGLVTFYIMQKNAKGMIKQAKKLKEGEKPTNYYLLYMLLSVIFMIAIVAVVGFQQYKFKKEGYNLVFLAIGYLINRAAIVISSLVLRKKVLY